MVLNLDHNDSASSGSMEKDVKSLSSDGPKRLSLLVDYSKGKAAINKERKRELLGNSSQDDCVRRSSVMDNLEDALKQTDISLDVSDKEGKDALNESLNLEDATASPQIKFRVRKRTIKRCSTFDERKLSSYDHLQKSIRSEMLMKEDESTAPTVDTEDTTKSSSSFTANPASPPINRRALLANANKTHQSMRNLTSTTTACSAASIAPPSTDKRALLANARKKHQSMRDLSSRPGMESLSNILGEDESNSNNPNGGRRAGLAATKCKSCRSLIRRAKSLQDSTSRLHCSFTMINPSDGDDEDNDGNNSNQQFLTKRTSNHKKNSSLESSSDHRPRQGRPSLSPKRSGSHKKSTSLESASEHQTRQRRVSPKPDRRSNMRRSKTLDSVSEHIPRRVTISPKGPSGKPIRKKKGSLDCHSDHVRRRDTLSDMPGFTGRRGGGLALMKSHTLSRRNLMMEGSMRDNQRDYLVGGYLDGPTAGAPRSGNRRAGLASMKAQTLSRRNLMESSMRDESSRRTTGLASLKAQTLSRRNLMESSMRDESSRRDNSLTAMNESTRFFTGSRIRRLDPLDL